MGRGSGGWTSVLAASLVALGCATPAGDGDPLEGMNRGVFWFNERVDQYLLEPVATGWDFVLPDVVQESIRNVYDNARFPVNFVNNVLQARPKEVGIDVARFLINTTVGVAGLLDPAATIGLEKNEEDFGQTLGYWGVPPGPYLVLPFLGPSNPRDGVGLAVDSVARVYPYFIPFYVSAAITGGDVVNRRSLLLEEIREEREAAFDWYAAVRNAYLQRREELVHDRRPAEDEAEDDDLYYFEEDEEGLEPDDGG